MQFSAETTVMGHEEVSEMKRNNKHSSLFKSINPASNQFCRTKTNFRLYHLLHHQLTVVLQHKKVDVGKGGWF